jgi:hypothetical protein
MSRIDGRNDAMDFCAVNGYFQATRRLVGANRVKGGAKPWKQAAINRKTGRHISLPSIDTDDRLDQWIAQRCVLEPEAITLTSTLVASYMQWALANGHKRPPFGWVGYQLTARGYIATHTRRGMARAGITVLITD